MVLSTLFSVANLRGCSASLGNQERCLASLSRASTILCGPGLRRSSLWQVRVLLLFQILDLVAVNCTNHRDIKRLEATILEHVRNEELFPEVVRVLPPVYRQVEAAIVDIAQGEEVAEHGERFWFPKPMFCQIYLTPLAPSLCLQ